MLFTLLITWLSVTPFQVFYLEVISTGTFFQIAAGWRPKVSRAISSNLSIIYCVKSTFLIFFSVFPIIIFCAHILLCSPLSTIKPSIFDSLIMAEHMVCLPQFLYNYIALPSCRRSFDWKNIHHESAYAFCHNPLFYIHLSLMFPPLLM